MNPWLFSFLISVVLLLLLARWKEISVNIHGGILSAIYMFVDVTIGDRLNLFEYRYVGLNLPQWPLFSDRTNVFLVGIAFNIGILILQFLPARPGWQMVYLVVWDLLLLAFLYLSGFFNLFISINLKPFLMVRQLLFFFFIAWFKDFYLTRRGKKTAIAR